jgi:acetaldehyde dehydrogenase/alcohol dehydrogenase
VLKFGGLGHTAVIHCDDKNLAKLFGIQMKAGRILINSPASQGAIGGLYNTNMPSLTLGCGSYGRNSTTDNISAMNLINRKKIYIRMHN